MTDNDHPSMEYPQEIEIRENEDLPHPAEVVERIRGIISERQKQWLEELQAQDELLRALAVGPEEAHQYEEVMWRIYSKLDLLPEVEELAQRWHVRQRRIREADDRFSAVRKDHPEHQGGR